jgi:N-hydroxyarylamine O-acetyltransferase
MADSFRLAEYLERLDIRGPVSPDLVTLKALHAAHVDAIPFENLDPFLGRPVRLDPAALQEKLVRRRRGGYCFEQNALFKAALEVIGFKVTGLAARVRWRSSPESPLGPRSHMLLKVDLGDGAYLADVGFGSCLLDQPLPLVIGVEHPSPMGRFLLTETAGGYLLHSKQSAGWRTAFLFDLSPQFPADYEVANWYTSTSPAAPFLRTLIMERVTSDKRFKLVDQRFTIENDKGELLEERTLDSAEDLGRVLEESFRITPPVVVSSIFARFAASDP